MSESEESNRTIADFKRLITDYMKQNDGVSFAELRRVIPGLDDDSDEAYFTSKNLIEHNLVLWVDVNDHAQSAICELCEEGLFHIVPTSLLVYLIDGCSLALPIAKRPNHRYKDLHWLPVVFKRGPQPKPTKKSKNGGAK